MRKNRNLIAHTNPKSPISEAYRTLRTNIQFSNIDGELKTIIITSAGPGEGKSTSIANLAIAIAQTDKKVLIIDADMRKSIIHKIFGLQNIRGLTNVLVEGVDYKSLIHRLNLNNLEILTSGPKPPNPSELLSSKRMKGFIDLVKEDYDMVLIDVPPVLPVADASALACFVDGVIMVVRHAQVTIEAALLAKEQLQKVNSKLLGVILNDIPMDNKAYNYYYYYYHNEEVGERSSLRNKKKEYKKYVSKKQKQEKSGEI